MKNTLLGLKVRKNLKQSASTIQANQVIRTEERTDLYNTLIPTQALKKIVELSKLIAQATITKNKKTAQLDLQLSTQRPPIIYFKLAKRERRDGFYVRSSPLGKKLFELLRTDFDAITSLFSQHVFSPHFSAFTEVISELKKYYQSENFIYFLPKSLLTTMSLDEAKTYIRIGYYFVYSLQKKCLNLLENNFDKPVRQNSLSLKKYLGKQIKTNKELQLVQLNLTLLNQDNDATDSVIVDEEKLWDQSRLHLNVNYMNETDGLSPRLALYKTLRNAREDYFRQIKKTEPFCDLLKGYIWKLDYKSFTSWSYKVVLFFETPPSTRLENTPHFCETLWLHLTNLPKVVKITNIEDTDPSPSIVNSRILKLTSKERPKEIEQLINELIRTDYLVRVKVPDGNRAFGKSEIRKKAKKA